MVVARSRSGDHTHAAPREEGCVAVYDAANQQGIRLGDALGAKVPAGERGDLTHLTGEVL